MPAAIVQVADAVVAALNAAALSLPFAAERAWAPARELDEMGGTVFVTVIPATLAVEAVDLGPRHALDWDLAIWVQARPGRDVAAVDPLMGLVEEIVGLFRTWRAAPTYRVARIEARPPLDRPMLDDAGLFSAAITLTVRVTRP